MLGVLAVIGVGVWLVIRFIRKGRGRKGKLIRGGVVAGILMALPTVIVVNLYNDMTRTVYYHAREPEFESAIKWLKQEERTPADKFALTRYDEADYVMRRVGREWRGASPLDRLDYALDAVAAEIESIKAIEHIIGRLTEAGSAERADKLSEVALKRESEAWLWFADTVERLSNTVDYRAEMRHLEREAETALTRDEYEAIVTAIPEVITKARARAKLAEAGTPVRP